MEAKESSEEVYDFDRNEICSFEDYDTEEAKEKASILWLLSRAFDGVIPSDLREPFYRDHEHHRHLKPKIVHSLANAELYCLALANIYSDPNYHNLDHHGIIQTIMRKGVTLVESKECPLTETILVQTAPLKMSAHMCVIDGIVSLYIKEVLIPEKIVEVVRRFAHVDLSSEMPSNPEEAAVLWINKCCVALEQEIKDEFAKEPEAKLPRIPVLQEIADISDGCSLAAVICFYCPDHLSWQDVCWNDPMSLGDSIYNIQLVKRFCCDNLPRQIDFLSLEDFLYVHPSIKANILVFVAELLFSFVIWPVNCVTRHMNFNAIEEQLQREGASKPRSSSIPSHKMHQNVASAIPNLRTDFYGGSTSSLPDLKSGSVAQNAKETSEKLMPTRKSTERIRMSPLLQRGGSSGIVNGYKSSSSSLANSGENDGRSSGSGCGAATDATTNVPSEAVRLSREFLPQSSGENRLSMGLEDYYHNLAAEDGPIRSGSLSDIKESKGWKNVGNMRPGIKSSASSQSSGICVSDAENRALSKTSFAELSKDPDVRTHSINIVYMQHDRDGEKKGLKSALLHRKGEKRTTFAALPNTTTWQQQKALSSSSSQADSGHETPVESGDPALNIQLANLRMKLEEKRRRIELEKKRMEALWKRERQKIGKAAFLQAVSHSAAGTDAGTPDSGTGKEDDESELLVVTPEKSLAHAVSSPSMVRRMSMQEIAEDLSSVQRKWLDKKDGVHGKLLAKEGALEAGTEVQMTEDFEASIEQLNSSLCDLQADISRITIQQERVENLMQDSVEDATHFFLHGQQNHPEEFQVSPSRTYQWNRDASPAAGVARTGEHSPFSISSLRQTYQRQSSLSEKKVSDLLASKPPLPSSPPVRRHEVVSVNLEELYSKVIKPENRPRVESPVKVYSLPEQQQNDLSVRVYHKQSESSPSRTAVGILRERNAQQQGDSHHQVQPEQGFYISFDDQPKKLTTKWQRPPSAGKKVRDAPQQPVKDDETNAFGFVIGADLVHPDPETEIEMAKKKEMIMNMSIRRRVDHESRRLAKEQEYARIREEERRKKEQMEKKREEERQRRQMILEQYKQRKIQEELEKDGVKEPPAPSGKVSASAVGKHRSRASKPRPKSAYVTTNAVDPALSAVDGIANKRNSQYIGPGLELPDFDVDSLNSASTSASSKERGPSPSNGRGGISAVATAGQLSPTRYSCDSGLSRPSEGTARSSDGASDTTSNSSNAAAAAEYTGPKLFVKPAAKSNRGIIVNAINTVLAGAVNADTKKKVLEEISKSESKHFLILFRDAGCQFRAIYSYNPDTEEVIKLYGIGPKSVTDKVMEKFYKYNSGGKCFSEVQTKHLTVTIDAFTIPNSLWAGKKVVPPRKEFF